jgi:uncharacterized protein YuzE
MKADRVEKKNMAEAGVEKISALVPHLLDIPYKKIWTDYDEEADVLYLNFKKPSHADDSELTDDDTVIRYEKGQVVGITYLNAKKRREK